MIQVHVIRIELMIEELVRGLVAWRAQLGAAWCAAVTGSRRPPCELGRARDSRDESTIGAQWVLSLTTGPRMAPLPALV